jgi:hypothetical protein
MTGQFLPAQQESAVEEVKHVVSRAVGCDEAADQSVFLLAMLVTYEQIERISSVMQRSNNGLDRDLVENIARHDAAADRGGGVPPHVERELLYASKAPGRLAGSTCVSRIRFGRDGHGYSSVDWQIAYVGWQSAMCDG